MSLSHVSGYWIFYQTNCWLLNWQPWISKTADKKYADYFIFLNTTSMHQPCLVNTLWQIMWALGLILSSTTLSGVSGSRIFCQTKPCHVSIAEMGQCWPISALIGPLQGQCLLGACQTVAKSCFDRRFKNYLLPIRLVIAHWKCV